MRIIAGLGRVEHLLNPCCTRKKGCEGLLLHAILARFEVVVEPFLVLKEAIMNHTVFNFCWAHVGRLLDG